MERRSILDHFPGSPRPAQVQVLKTLERQWNSHDVFIVRAPVGSGKSKIAECLASWTEGATIITPTNQLVDQYTDGWPEVASLAKRSAYSTEREYLAAKAQFMAADSKVANYYTYLAHRAYSRTLVVDEAHRLIPTLIDFEGVKLWEHLTPISRDVGSIGELMMWCQQHKSDKAVAKLLKLLTKHPNTYTLEWGEADYRGKEHSRLRVYPLTPRNNKPILWPPGRVKKLVFMSATFHNEDLYDLGLEGRRVCVVDCESPIAPEDRAVVYESVGSLGFRHQSENLPKLVSKLLELMSRHPDERGVVHTTYALAAKLRQTELWDHPRLRWHGQTNKARVYRSWLREGGNAVLVGCGMAEGLDLKGDLAKWQVVTKLMYPDRGDPVVAAKLQIRPDWYAWCAARDLQQAIGRSSRGPGDKSTTYIVDGDFTNLYTKHSDMFPPSWHESLIIV